MYNGRGKINILLQINILFTGEYLRQKIEMAPKRHSGAQGKLTVIRFVRVSAKFGTFTVVSATETLVEANICAHSPLTLLRILSSKSVPFILTTVQVPI
jgi:hypothetical protein